ncbi:DHHC palmitoyltransferase-domain-containing protein [Phycomyces blakesleeanus]|uniref:Palmitoyltransferase n=1 Tax=Phycomyces blakesleeanus TaxID=4837 RepID=A0ABR3BK54_PHYBL
MSSNVGMAVANGALPIIAYGLLIYTWYIYVFRVCQPLLLNQDQAAMGGIFIFITTALWWFSLISYLRILLSHPGKPAQSTHTYQISPTIYSPSLFDISTMTTQPLSLRDEIPLPLLSLSRADGGLRYCTICCCYKPDRTHHCKECNSCVLKMDHHCPWIIGCVGHGNYKFFFLFVLYTGLYGVWCLCSALPLVVNAVQYKDFLLDPQWIALLILAFIFGFTIFGFAASHCYYIMRNETTIEHINDRPYEVRVDFDPSGTNYEIVSVQCTDMLWDNGISLNWRATMGSNPLGWFVPLWGGMGDGSVHPYNPTVYYTVVERAKCQRMMLNPHSLCEQDALVMLED